MKSVSRTIVAVVGLSLGVFAGCGGSDDSGSPAATSGSAGSKAGSAGSGGSTAGSGGSTAGSGGSAAGSGGTSAGGSTAGGAGGSTAGSGGSTAGAGGGLTGCAAEGSKSACEKCCQKDNPAGWASVLTAVASKCACIASGATCTTECGDNACAGKPASSACGTCLETFAKTDPPPQCAKDGIKECQGGADCAAYFACSGTCK